MYLAKSSQSPKQISGSVKRPVRALVLTYLPFRFMTPAIAPSSLSDIILINFQPQGFSLRKL